MRNTIASPRITAQKTNKHIINEKDRRVTDRTGEKRRGRPAEIRTVSIVFIVEGVLVRKTRGVDGLNVDSSLFLGRSCVSSPEFSRHRMNSRL